MLKIIFFDFLDKEDAFEELDVYTSRISLHKISYVTVNGLYFTEKTIFSSSVACKLMPRSYPRSQLVRKKIL